MMEAPRTPRRSLADTLEGGGGPTAPPPPPPPGPRGLTPPPPGPTPRRRPPPKFTGPRRWHNRSPSLAWLVASDLRRSRASARRRAPDVPGALPVVRG